MGKSVSARLLSVLGAFDDTHRRLTLSELSRRSGLPIATTHRLVAELVEWGALTRLTAGRAAGEYVVGRRLWELSMLAPDESGLRRLAEPFLHDIHAATLATVHLAVRDQVEVLYVARVSGNKSVPIVSTVGGRLPLHATGVGKVLLAHAPEEIQAKAMQNLTRLTAYTITQPGRLKTQLERIRRDGYAQTVEEMTLGACSVAVPIRVPNEMTADVVAAVGVVVPDLKRDRPRLVAALEVAAQGIGRRISAPTFDASFPLNGRID